ncbi:unnamed protein product [Polarella glacialis]|uniref:Uncharacterized protein n=1 Tax=Polarella glacialis TaxID=89957 RepID=A0A813GC06_POLGL|nr:unnamed protein product [Polarella glacialis]CAE8647498.1 unnamed protein product [Polarella glacialis]
MLSADHHSVDLLRLRGAVRVLQVLDGHLGLAVWPQPPAFAVLAHVCQCLAQANSEVGVLAEVATDTSVSAFSVASMIRQMYLLLRFTANTTTFKPGHDI